MQLRDRFIVAEPDGRDGTLARAAQDAGSWALVDATRPGETDILAHLDPDRTVLRTRPGAPVRPGVGLAMLATWRIEPEHVPTLTQTIDAWNRAGVPVAVEVRTREEGRRALDAGADVLVARGAEGPGRASERSNLVLLPTLAELDVPLIAWGGAGPHATGALLVHADAVVLDAQLYLLDEAGLSDAWRRSLSAFDGSDVKALGNTLGEPYHVHARPADEHVHELWEAEQTSQEGLSTRRETLERAVEERHAGFDVDPGQGLRPLGHDAAHASFFARFETLEDALAFLEERVDEQLSGFALEENNPLARDHGTRYPVVQGAMANVSEVPAFAEAVADAGGLPFLAFAALRESWAREALEGTIETLDEDQPFGCGIIGLDVNAEKRDAHIRLLKEHEPPFALIAAGTAEQALDLQEAGIDTYLHTPSRGIVKQALEMGLDRIVVEGNECGGHIGKLPSLVLWDQALQEVDAQDAADAKVLLAGGIGDEDTSAMAGTLAAATPASVGALMGTAYLATQEIVETGAIPDSYQDLVLAAKDTHVTGRTTGIRSRSAPTPFTQRVAELERELLQEGVPLDERKREVEHQNLGATRLAARRLKRDDDGSYHEVSVDEQFQEGNFLMGQGAERIEERTTITELHERVTRKAADRTAQATERLSTPLRLPQPARETSTGQDTGAREDAIAIVGLGCVLPDAPDVESFWDNLVEGHVSIRELPEDRWPVHPDAHHRPHEEDGTYTLLGGFVQEDTFDPIERRIPPTVADQMDPSQKWAIQATEQALADAGLDEVEERDRWAVILGNAQGGEHKNWSERRLALREAIAELSAADADPETLDALEAQLDNYPAITEDTMPGELSNIIASRVCNTFDIGGPARTVDTACASSLAATEEAVRQLRNRDVDVAITGGVDHSMDPAAYVKFSAIGALSDEGSFPFDERASGFVMGEGCGIFVLKRLHDAVEDGDHVYALVEGAGSSSDGAGKGITAPDEEGQARAVQRAWEDAGADPDTLAFVEAHGTGTPVGDPTEAATLGELFADQDDVALGSVKANIGHLKSAAGAAGLLKAVLALDRGRLPPTPVEQPTPHVDWETSPLTLATEPVELPGGSIRAGVSAFGFGGTNSHVVLASAPEAPGREEEPSARPTGRNLDLEMVSGQSRAEVERMLDEPPRTWSFDPNDPVRLAMLPDADPEDAEQVLVGELPVDLALSKGVCLAEGEASSLGLVFPGQGSQYPGMVLDLADTYPAARDVLDEADQVLTPLIGRPLSEFLALEGEAGEEALEPTEVCQPAVLTCDIAILRVLEERGVEPDVVAGHSLGEYAALVAADVIAFEDALKAVSARGREMAEVAEEEVDDPGGLVAVRAGPDQADELIEGLDAWPANLNGPEQTVLAATTEALDAIEQRAEEADVKASRLPVSAAFHSPVVAPATEPLRRVLDRMPVDPPRVPVIANTTAEPYPEDPDAIRELLARQVASPVRWSATMQAFEDRGVDLVLETGPKPILTGLARANLPDATSLPTAHPRLGAERTLEACLVALAAHGHLAIDRDPVPEQPPEPVQRAPEQRSSTAHAGGPARQASRDIVVSGVSLGLPSPDPDADPFDPGHVDALMEGSNRIAPVPDGIRRSMAEMGVTRLVKDGRNGPRLEAIESSDDVVQLSGRIPDVDLGAYAADEDWLVDADPTARLAVAAALEALTDAHIPLVPDEHEASTGTTLTHGWVLPEPMREETGVILASAFPGHASLVDAVTRHAGTQPAHGQAPSQDGLSGYLADLMPHLEDRQARKAALELLTEHAAASSDPPGRTDEPSPAALAAEGGSPHEEGFPRDFLFRTLAMGHAQVAQLLEARGPNVQVNAACASTTAAIAMAQDWIEQGRCERVIVVGADVAGNPELLPWIGSGFLAAGAASTEADVGEAALPFDERRHGMLVGSGAVGLVLETEEAAEQRGVTPIARLVEAHVANSAFHGARLEPDHVAEQVDQVIERAQRRLELDAGELADELVFVSHEPATPARGGSAEAEVEALRTALGENATRALITNTKGLTGHAMGAGIEDGVAVELLRARRAPPVANLQQVDPAFEDLAFSEGGSTDRSLSLRFAAGFGSQIALALFQRAAPEPGAVDEKRFGAWLEAVAGPGHRVDVRDRCLRLVRDETTPSAPAGEDGRGGEAVEEVASEDGAEPEDVLPLLTELVSAKTGYPEDVIEPGMDLEADLGVDTVKQAEILSGARDELDIPPIEGLSLSDVPTLEDAAALLTESKEPAPPAPAGEDVREGEAAEQAASEGSDPPSGPGPEDESADGGTEEDEVLDLLRDLVSRKTGYPEDVIEPGMDLEADLGVDTVKQAEILSSARDELDIPPIEGLSLSDVPTLEDAAALLTESKEPAPPAPAGEDGREEETVGRTTAEDEQEGELRVLEPVRAPAEAAAKLPAGARVHVAGSMPPTVRPALEAAGAQVAPDMDGADLVVLGLEALPVDAEALADLLTRLQAVPEGARIVLLADADEPVGQGLPALAGTLTAEGWPTRAVRVAEPVSEERLVDELLLETDQSVTLTPSTRRTEGLERSSGGDPVEIPEDPVVLAPGGLGAAVVPCLEALAREHDLRIAVAGRSRIEDTELDPDDEDQVDALRQRLLEEARQGEDPVRPAAVEAKVEEHRKRARRARALARLEAVAEVHYTSLDARDPKALSAWIDEVEDRWGSPALVVHGTGLEASRAFADKDADEMEAVLGVKLDPVRELTERLPEAHHVAFGSIAGVRGNPGQADYALANGILPGLLAPVDGTVIQWTAWDAAGGMADDETVRAVLEERGVRFLDPDEGARLFVERFATPGTHVVTDLEPTTPLARTDEGARMHLDGEEAWLADHSIGDRPLVPGVRSLQAIRETAQRHGSPVEELDRIRFEQALWVTDPVEARIVLDGDQARVEQDERVHARARIGPGDGVKLLDPVETPEEGLGREEIYETFFHGPSFQVLERAQAEPEKVRASADLAAGGAAPWALAVEACLQAAGLGDRSAGASPGLPAGIEALRVASDPGEAHAVVHARLVQRDLGGSTWDATVRDPDGDVLVAVRGLRLASTETTGRLVEALAPLQEATGADTGIQRVDPHDPRDPRAKRTAEREAGTQAAARALENAHGEPVDVQRDGEGRPEPVGADGGVSITHGHGVAVAAAHPDTEQVGIDLERVEARGEAWLVDHFTEDERAWILDHELGRDAAATLAWTLKEAAAKAIGTGLTEPAERFEVHLDGDRATVRTPSGPLAGRWALLDEIVVSLAHPEDGEPAS